MYVIVSGDKKFILDINLKSMRAFCRESDDSVMLTLYSPGHSIALNMSKKEAFDLMATISNAFFDPDEEVGYAGK